MKKLRTRITPHGWITVEDHRTKYGTDPDSVEWWQGEIVRRYKHFVDLPGEILEDNVLSDNDKRELIFKMFSLLFNAGEDVQKKLSRVIKELRKER